MTVKARAEDKARADRRWEIATERAKRRLPWAMRRVDRRLVKAASAGADTHIVTGHSLAMLDLIADELIRRGFRAAEVTTFLGDYGVRVEWGQDE